MNQEQIQHVNLNDVADKVQRWAKHQEGIIELASALRQIGGIEQAEREASIRLEATQGRLAEEQRKIGAAETRAQELLDGAQRQADQVTAQAREQARKLQEDTVARVREVEEAHTARIAGLKEQERHAQEGATAAKATLDGLQTQISEAETKLADLRKRARENLAAIGA